MCFLVSTGKPSGNAGEKNSQKNNNSNDNINRSK